MTRVDDVADIACGYVVSANIAYDEHARCRLDLYRPFAAIGPRPALVFFHGGGWAADAFKESWCLWFLPFLARGWIVANVDYRPTEIAPAPAAIDDAIKALDWVRSEAIGHGVDLSQLVLGGLSSGGHLALMAGLRATAKRVDGDERFHLAAIINWCGPTDVGDLLVGENRQEFAVRWVGDSSDPQALARTCSPLFNAHRHAPPIMTIHASADTIVPYAHAERLHGRLGELGVPEKLLRLERGDHGTLPAYAQSYSAVFEFVADQVERARDENERAALDV